MAVDFSGVNEAALRAFGQSVTYAPAGGQAFTITGVLEQAAQLEGDFPESYVTLFVLASAFTVPPAAGDQVTVSGKTYNVIGDPEEDAGGGVRLRLHKA